MAANAEPPAATDANMGEPHESSGPGEASSAAAPAGADPNGGARAGTKRKGKTGRAERSRQPKAAGRDAWREYKRRKTNTLSEGGESKNPFSKEEIEAEARRPKRKVAVMVGYSGTGYKGMQLNGDEKTIERDIFRAFVAAGAISKANADDPKKSSLSRCARTDKGVHAAGNVISLKLIIEDDDIVDRINDALPPQIRVWGIQRTNNNYNCYQYCDSRWYEYLLPSYCLLPPHPQSFLGKKLAEVNKEYGADEEVAAKMADVSNFWADVEEKEIKPILARLDPEIRAAVLERVHTAEGPGVGDGPAAAEPPAEKAEAQGKPETAEGAAASASAQDEPVAEAPADATGNVTLETVQSKHRELGPIDYALRDIKAAYISAKRRYRVTPGRLQMLQAVLDEYRGTRNFHNYTVQKSHADPSAKRHIKSFVANPQPVIIGDTEWLSLKVHGQSFMMHQIRKMVGLACLSVRCGTPVDRVRESYGQAKMAIPKAPGLGLLLERPVFDNYSRRAVESLNRPPIDFDQYEDRMDAFKQAHIYTRIFDVEEQENSFHAFFNQIDQFKSNHFLWVTAGGMKVAELHGATVGETQENVDKQLGDEDEDPEGGEG